MSGSSEIHTDLPVAALLEPDMAPVVNLPWKIPCPEAPQGSGNGKGDTVGDCGALERAPIKP